MGVNRRFIIGILFSFLIIAISMIINIELNYSQINSPLFSYPTYYQQNTSQNLESDLEYNSKKESPSASELNNEILNYVIKKEADRDKASPSDWVSEDKIKVYKNEIIIKIPNAEWARFTNTKSMDPVIDSNANAIEIVPKNASQIKVGDIISFTTEYTNGTIIHRVIKKGTDEKGVFFITKGDNNENPDPGKLRFKNIKRVLIAIIY